MPRRSTLTLSSQAVDSLPAEGRDRIFWDRELPGFGVRVYRSGQKVYVVQSRARGGPRRVTLGSHGELTTAQARLRAGQVTLSPPSAVLRSPTCSTRSATGLPWPTPG